MEFKALSWKTAMDFGNIKAFKGLSSRAELISTSAIMSDPVILVHAQLPTVKPSDPRYSDISSWVWVPFLEFPIDRVNRLRFSAKPLKWIRYCIGAITGARGHLSRKANSLEVIDYDQPLSSESVSMVLYYHVKDTEKELMFPTDSHLADPPKTNSVHSRASTTTSSIACQSFHQDLQDRDTRCVATGWNEMYCDAVHLVPHCKDDNVRTAGVKMLGAVYLRPSSRLTCLRSATCSISRRSRLGGAEAARRHRARHR